MTSTRCAELIELRYRSARQAQYLGGRANVLKTARPAAKKLVKGGDLTKYITLSAATRSASILIVIGDQHMLRCVHVFMTTVV
jgi:hypothetical protein